MRLTCLSYLHHATQLRVGLRRERDREEKKGTDCIARLLCLTLPLSVIKFSSFIYTEQLRYLLLLLFYHLCKAFSYLQDKEQRKKKQIREVMAKKVSYGNDM